MTPLLTFTMATPTPAPPAPGAGLFTSPFLLSLLIWVPAIVAVALAFIPNHRGRYDVLIKQIAFFTNLGTLFVQGYGGKDGPERAPGLLSAACEKNVFTACTSLGAVEAQKQDLDGASKLADRACQGGDADGCTLLGDLFAKSNDVLRAGVAYAKACQAGAPAGCYGQGVLLVHSGADRDKGLKLLQKACNDGETRACEAARSPDL